MYWDQGLCCCQATFESVFKETFNWKWSGAYLKKKKKRKAATCNTVSFPVNNRDLYTVKAGLQWTSNVVQFEHNSPMGLVSLLLQCRQEWNSGLGIDWMGPECFLPWLLCCSEALWRTEGSFVKQYPQTKTHEKTLKMFLRC